MLFRTNSESIWCRYVRRWERRICLRFPPWFCSTSSILNLGEEESSIKSPPKNIQKAATPEFFEQKPLPTCVVFLHHDHHHHHHHDHDHDSMSFEVDERWSSSSWSEWRSEADGGESWMKEVRRHTTRYLGCTKNWWKTWGGWVWLTVSGLFLVGCLPPNYLLQCPPSHCGNLGMCWFTPSHVSFWEYDVSINTGFLA